MIAANQIDFARLLNLGKLTERNLEELDDPVSFGGLFQKIDFAHLYYYGQSQVN